VIPHPNTKFPAHAALPRGLAVGSSVNAPNLADGHPCPTTAGKLSVGICAVAGCGGAGAPRAATGAQPKGQQQSSHHAKG